MGDPAGGPVRVELLGRFRVVVGDRVLPDACWPSRRSAELVQLLALTERRRLLRDQVVEALWPHLSPAAGAANLRKAAHHARQALGRPDAVVLAGGLVELLPDTPVEVDADRFARTAEAALRDGAAACAAALATHPGELLPDERYAEWTRSTRAWLRHLHLELLRRAGRWTELAEAEPSDEQAHRELMRAALRAGNRHSALRWYGRLRAHLRRELGVAPDAETAALYEECLAGADPARPAVVGRDVELARAEAALRAAERGELGALVVRGPAGIGKTTVCRELAAAADARGWRVVTVVAEREGRPYAPLAAAVRDLAGRRRGVLDALPGPARAVLAALAGAAPIPEDGLTRHAVVGALRRLLVASRDVTGVLLVVDDAHLADTATAEACAFLARVRGGPPALTVLAYRAEAAEPALVQGVAGLDRAGRAAAVDLGPLDGAAVAALVEAGAARPPTRAELGRIVDLAEGNPFLALELARAGAASATPWEAVASRFLDLDRDAVAMLRPLAIVAEDVDADAVLALTGLPEEEAFALLDAAIAGGVLVVADERYRFRHDLLRQALVEQVPPHQRIAMHREVARRLAGTGAPPALVARHWLAGRRPAEAAGWLLVAARDAVAFGAFPDALGHLDALLTHAPGDAAALRLQAEVLDALGDGRASAAYAAAARAVGVDEADDLRAMQALAELKQGDPAAALRTVEGLAPATVPGRLAQALTLSGAAALGFADPALGTAKAAECRRLALESGDRAAIVVASWAQAAAAHARGELRGSVRADLRETHALPELAVRVFDGHLCITQRLLYGARPYPDVIAFADALAAEARRLGAARGHAFAVTLRGEAELLSGRLDEAETDLRAAIGLNQDIGAAVGEALALQRLAEVALRRGAARDAEALVDEALAVARETDIGFHLFDRIYGTRIALADDPAAALAALEEAECAVRGPLETCPGCRITFAVPAAIAAARGGDHERALRHAEAAEFLAGVVMRLPGWNAAVEEVRGHLHRAGGEPTRAAAHFRSAAAAFRAAGQPLDGARCAALAARV